MLFHNPFYQSKIQEQVRNIRLEVKTCCWRKIRHNDREGQVHIRSLRSTVRNADTSSTERITKQQWWQLLKRTWKSTLYKNYLMPGSFKESSSQVVLNHEHATEELDLKYLLQNNPAKRVDVCVVTESTICHSGQEFAVDSTPARRSWLFDKSESFIEDHGTALVWDTYHRDR